MMKSSILLDQPKKSGSLQNGAASRENLNIAKIVVFVLYIDFLFMINMFINTTLFKLYRTIDIVSLSLLIAFIISKAFIVLRLINGKLLPCEKLSVVMLLLAAVLQHEINVLYLLQVHEEDLQFKSMSIFYYSNLFFIVPMMYLFLSHRLLPKYSYFVDYILMLYFSFRQTYQNASIVSSIVVGVMDFLCLVLTNAILKSSYIRIDQSSSGPHRTSSQSRNLDYFELGLNSSRYENSNSHRNDTHYITSKSGKLHRANSDIGMKKTTAKNDLESIVESYPIKFDWCYIYPLNKQLIEIDVKRTTDKRLVGLYQFIKKNLNDAKTIWFTQTSPSRMPNPPEPQANAGNSDTESDYYDENGMISVKEKFVFQSFDTLSQTIHLKSTHKSLNELLEDLSKEYSEKKLTESIPFYRLVDKTQVFFKKSKTFSARSPSAFFENLNEEASIPASDFPRDNFRSNTSRKDNQEDIVNQRIINWKGNKIQVEITATAVIWPPSIEFDQNLKPIKRPAEFFDITIVPLVGELPSTAGESSQGKRSGIEFRVYAKKHLIKSNKSANLLNLISHEMRSPLVAILGFIKLFIQKVRVIPGIAEDPTFHQLQEDYLNRSATHIDNLLEACQCILDLAKNGKDAKLKATEFSLKKLISETVKLFQSMNRRSEEVQVMMAYDNKCDEFIKSDPIRIRQILINLISNALKYTLKGEVKVVVEKVSFKEILISVKDTGIGIKKENLDKLFKQFGRIKSKQDEILNDKGVGLGLDLSNQLAYSISPPNRKLGITVSSVYGQGSTFSIWVQNYFIDSLEMKTFLAKLQHKEAEEDLMDQVDKMDVPLIKEKTKKNIIKKMQTMKKAENVKVMIVDDSEHNLEFTETLFQNLNIGCESFTSPNLALEKVKERLQVKCNYCRVYDLILVDYEMPFMNGSEFAEAVRKFEEYQSVPIICGSAHELDLTNELNKCFTYCLLKPISFKDVQFILDDYVVKKPPHVCEYQKSERDFSKKSDVKDLSEEFNLTPSPENRQILGEFANENPLPNEVSKYYSTDYFLKKPLQKLRTEGGTSGRTAQFEVKVEEAISSKPLVHNKPRDFLGFAEAAQQRTQDLPHVNSIRPSEFAQLSKRSSPANGGSVNQFSFQYLGDVFNPSAKEPEPEDQVFHLNQCLPSEEVDNPKSKQVLTSSGSYGAALAGTSPTNKGLKGILLHGGTPKSSPRTQKVPRIELPPQATPHDAAFSKVDKK